jgi:hypothetical protein
LLCSEAFLAHIFSNSRMFLVFMQIRMPQSDHSRRVTLVIRHYEPEIAQQKAPYMKALLVSWK